MGRKTRFDDFHKYNDETCVRFFFFFFNAIKHCS